MGSKKENESISSKVLQKISVITDIYLKNDENPIEAIPGLNEELPSCNVNELRIGVLTNASNVVEAALIPGVFENISIMSPKAKDHNKRMFLSTPEL